jgi:hypothetical protein
MPKKEPYPNVAKAINDIRDEVNAVLDERRKDQYFASIVLVYSFIENILRWFVFVKLVWEAGRVMKAREYNTMRKYCKSLTFYSALQQAFALGLIDWPLFRRLESIRQERNDVVHQFWLYIHRGNNLVIRKKLEKLARAASDLVVAVNRLVSEISMDEVYELMLDRSL